MENVKSFIGLDFGTSTSVVSLIRIGNDEKMLIESLSLDQPQENGGTTRHHLVNTVLANIDGKILFGRDAQRLRPFLRNGIDVFSSFKMLLGLDLGPNYPQTSLRRGEANEPIETAKDAATLFFKRLKTAITAALIREGQPTEWAIAVTVPASFEANQRRDLRDCLTEAGLNGFVGFIDEPNAAFLSHLFETALTGEGLGIDIKMRPFTVCVYDIGAGTCDVSILDIVEQNGFPVSRNRSISRFTALGGDDLDRLIARDVLLPQLREIYPDFDPAEGDIEQRIIPRLMPTAEMLKIAATNRLRDAGARTIDDCRGSEAIVAQPIKRFSERDRKGKKFFLELARPKMSLAEFASAIVPMLSASVGMDHIKHVYAPVANALGKADLKPRDIDAVLFIGGTALNPLIRHAIMSRFPESTRAIVPRDLQIHVSMGAALHAYALDQRGIDMIAPITPEAIYVLVRGGELEPVIRAGTVVPMAEPSTSKMIIDRVGQKIVELPICVGSEDKMLGLLRIETDRSSGFPRGSEVIVQARVTHEKLLEVTAKVDGKSAQCELLNPLSNEEQGVQGQALLEARQAFNNALLRHCGRPPAEIVKVYALSAIDAHEYPLAADLFQKLERLEKDQDHSVYISYAYARAQMHQLASEWKIRALERNPNDVAALYNRSLDLASHEAVGLLRRALNISPNFRPAKLRLSTLLIQNGDNEGVSMRMAIMEEMSRELDHHNLVADECLSLAALAQGVGDTSLAERASARANTLGNRKTAGISNANLVDSLVPKAQLRPL
jgi:molecular chaperone DnaK